MSVDESCDFPLGTVVSERYTLKEVIERGGYGIVYLALDQKFEPAVPRALKFLRLTRDTADWRWQRFLEESSSLASMNHPGLVTVMDRSVHDGFLYFVMEFLGRRTLRSILKEYQNGLPLAQAVRIIKQIGQALSAVHALRLYHCDLKPANVMLCPLLGGGEHIKIIDFGIARLTEPIRSENQNFPVPVGTLKYMAPEQFSVAADSSQITAATDIYAFTILAYELLTGRYPWDDQRALILPRDAQMIPANSVRDELGPEVSEILRRGIADEPQDRYQDASEFVARLVMALDTKQSSPQLASVKARPAVRTLLVATDAVADQQAAEQFTGAIQRKGYAVVHTDGAVGINVAQALEEELSGAQLVVALVSRESLDDQVWVTLTTQAETLTRAKDGRLVFILLEENVSIPQKWRHVECVKWHASITDALVAEILRGPPTPSTLVMTQIVRRSPEPPVGPLHPQHPLYIQRDADSIFLESVEGRQSILLVKGPRQFGKTSLLSRGGERASSSGFRIVMTDCKGLNDDQFASLKDFYLALGRSIAHWLRLSCSLRESWDDLASSNENFAKYVRENVLADGRHLFWALDGVDRILTSPFNNDVFGMFRSWHNERSNHTSDGSAWRRLTLAIGYSTEAARLISDQNQSPFNVGVKCELSNFDLENVRELNGRYGNPLRSENEIIEFHQYTGGHPLLTQQGLDFLARRGVDGWKALQKEAAHHVGPFGEHLRGLVKSVREHSDMRNGLVKLLQDSEELTADEFYDLLASGLIVGHDPAEAHITSQLYADFFRRELALRAPPPPRRKNHLVRFVVWLKS